MTERNYLLSHLGRIKNTTHAKMGTSEMLFPELSGRRTSKEREGIGQCVASTKGFYPLEYPRIAQ
jgi:hypothetical protein